MREMPVLFVSAALGVGGAERQWAELIPKLRERGFDPSVLTLYSEGPLYEKLAREGVPTRCAHMRSRTDVRGIGRALAQGHAGRLVVSQSFAAQAVAHAIARRAHVPHVTTEHHGPGLPRRSPERALLRILSPRIDAVVAVTRTQIPDLVDLGYRRPRIRVIPNGICKLVPRRPRELVRQELGLDDDAFVAVLAATLRPEKQAHLFVEAVVRASSTNGQIRGLVAGAGPEFPRIEALAKTTGGVVQALGQRADVIDLLAMADAVCLSSSTEALPMAVLEAMALAKPVVATDVGGVRDVVKHEETGLLVPLNDPLKFARALLRLAEDPELGARLGSQARQRQMTRFSADRMADDYALLFQSLAASYDEAR
jgi:glycosyltransferase involved in cell wall biosynthesis